jgi:hypothetical protein
MTAPRLLSRSSALLGAGVLFLGACELALRLAGFSYPSLGQRSVVWSREHDVELRSGTGLHVLDVRQMWKPRAGACIPWTRDEHVNAQGFRGPELPLAKSPGVLRIALLGDETTFGAGVTWDDTYAAHLMRGLGELGIAAEVLDAGVAGTTILQGIERYRSDVRPYAPDVVVCAYSGLHEYTAAPGSCADEERMAGTCGAPLASIFETQFPRDQLRTLQVLAWMRDLYFGDAWRERDFTLQEQRRAAHIGEFSGGGVRRVDFKQLRDKLSELASEARGDGALVAALIVPHKSGGPYDSDVMHYFQLATEKGAEQASVPLALGRLAFFEGVKLSRIAPGDLFTADGAPSDCGHILLAQVLIDTLLPHLGEVRRLQKSSSEVPR